jgi:cbb3-type cytochrome oxidase subunit 3
MEKEVLQNMMGVEIYPVVALIMFMLFFFLILGWIFSLKKQYITEMENIPLEENNYSESEENLNAGGVK